MSKPRLEISRQAANRLRAAGAALAQPAMLAGAKANLSASASLHG